MADEIFESAIRSTGDRAGVFEYDGETGYFYLYDCEAPEGKKVVDAVQVVTGQADFGQEDVAVRWDLEEQKVGLFIRDVLWAVFNVLRGTKCSGRYAPRSLPSLPSEEKSGFTYSSGEPRS